MKKKYIVHLTDDQRHHLNTLLRKGKHSARKLNRARILLLTAANLTDDQVAQQVGVTAQTVRNTRKRFAEQGLTEALAEKPRTGRPEKLSARAEAYAIAIACAQPPLGRTQWTMQLIADKLVEFKLVDSISDEAIRLRLKKRR